MVKKISLINPPSPDGTIYMKELGRCGRRAVAGEVWPQTGLAYLAAIIRDIGSEVQLIDGMGAGYTQEQTLKEISDFYPDLTIIHVTTPTASNDTEFCHLVKKILPETIVGVIGTHPTALGKNILEPGIIDFAVIGEAEQTIREICKTGSISKKIPGIIHSLSDGEIIDGGERQLIQNLDDLPFPAHDLLPIKNHKMPFFGTAPFVTVIPGRGCPFHCTFCRAGSVWGHKIRLRSIDNIIHELEHINNDFGIRNIIFMTDLFTINKEWVTELCECMIERNPYIKWICNSRVDGVTPELTKIMSKAGCQLISYGIESGDEDILKKSKKQITLKQAEDAIRWTREAGILSFGYFIIGLPGETWETVDRTIETAIRINPDYAFFHLATPFPGTDLYTWVKENNYLVSDNWADYDEDDGRAMRTEAMSLEDLQKAKRLATRKFYLRPSKIFQSIRQIRGSSDLLSKSQAALKILKKNL